MSNRNYITVSEVPELTGDNEANVAQLQAYLFKMVGQLEYELGNLEKRISALEKKQE